MVWYERGILPGEQGDLIRFGPAFGCGGYGSLHYLTTSDGELYAVKRTDIGPFLVEEGKKVWQRKQILLYGGCVREGLVLGCEDLQEIVPKGRGFDVIFEVARDGSIHTVAYQAMDWIASQTLREKLDAGIAPRESARAGLYLIEALDTLHGRGVTWGDVKPENVLWDDKVHAAIDFQLSHHTLELLSGCPERYLTALRMAQELEKESLKLKTVSGTPPYLSYEMLTGAEGASPRHDRYAAAVTAFELLTGRNPAYVCSAVAEGADSREKLDAIVEFVRSTLVPDALRRNLEILKETLFTSLGEDRDVSDKIAAGLYSALGPERDLYLLTTALELLEDRSRQSLLVTGSGKMDCFVTEACGPVSFSLPN